MLSSTRIGLGYEYVTKKVKGPKGEKVSKKRSCPESNRGCRKLLRISESGVITATLQNRVLYLMGKLISITIIKFITKALYER